MSVKQKKKLPAARVPAADPAIRAPLMDMPAESYRWLSSFRISGQLLILNVAASRFAPWDESAL